MIDARWPRLGKMEFLTPPVLTAIVGGVVSIVVAVVSSAAAYRSASRRNLLEKELAAEKQHSETLLSEQRHRFEQQLSTQKHEFQMELLALKRRFDPDSIKSVEGIALKLFEEYPRRLRKFSVFTSKIPTYSEKELREILINMGAQRTTHEGQEAHQLVTPRSR